MMLFEEFFKKKKINLAALQQDDEGLFLEFKEHYEQMGEKSFDHTKKYWFNKLRRQYPLPPEVKAEKLRAENQIAEQTVTDTLTEPSPRDKAPDLAKPQTEGTESKSATADPKLGFKPKFKQAAPATPATEENTQPTAEGKEKQPTDLPANSAPKVGFKPRFKAGVTAAKPAEETTAPAKPEDSTNPEATTESNAASKMGFKPRFKAGVTTSKPTEEIQPTPVPPETKDMEASAEQPDNGASANVPAPAKPGFKTRFKAGVTTTQSTENAQDSDTAPKDASTTPNAAVQPDDTIAEEQPAPAKLGFKPRFKAGVTTTKPAEENIEKPDAAKEDAPSAEDAKAEDNTTENPAPKPAYKPRFNPNMVKRKPADEQ